MNPVPLWRALSINSPQQVLDHEKTEPPSSAGFHLTTRDVRDLKDSTQVKGGSVVTVLSVRGLGCIYSWTKSRTLIQSLATTAAQ